MDSHLSGAASSIVRKRGPLRVEDYGASYLESYQLIDRSELTFPTRPTTTEGPPRDVIVETKQNKRFAWLAIFKAWVSDLCMIIAVIGLLIAIATILRLYDGQRHPNWSLNLNLNSIIAILATILRSSIVAVTEERNM